ncbi:hypothetical protein Rhein_1242 [Rheinheimera sp. A13L]|uniref:hypothetical protein n=1 Tax=Rheinheimera sp. A13L TaxID=506534 RepID=UPI000212486A|nr:hypothetical protein [Rheinheimera sp. A13L]EGM78670.1 hypothetical protein Rhein_1242 [Rheinheimera sp. A13L]
MKIDAGINYLYNSQQTQSSVDSYSKKSLSVQGYSDGEPAAAKTDSKQADFHQMTRQEMRGWVNEQIRSGEMSLDESRAFMAMTMNIPVDAGATGELLMADNGEAVNFMQKVRDGIEGALSRHDKDTLNMLQTAMSAMQQHQGRTIGIDTKA